MTSAADLVKCDPHMASLISSQPVSFDISTVLFHEIFRIVCNTVCMLRKFSALCKMASEVETWHVENYFGLHTF